jgi:hypothetical protein
MPPVSRVEAPCCSSRKWVEAPAWTLLHGRRLERFVRRAVDMVDAVSSHVTVHPLDPSAKPVHS